MTIRVPAFNLAQIEKRTKQLVQQGCYGFEECVLVQDTFEAFVRQLAKQLPHDVPLWTLRDSCRTLLGQPLTKPAQVKLARRLASHVPDLLAGLATHPWTTQMCDEWVPFRIKAGRVAHDSRSRVGWEYELYALAGSLAGETINKFWTARHYRYISLLMGFQTLRTKTTPKRLLQDPSQLVGMQFCGFIEVAKSGHRPGFQQVRVTPRMQEANREVMDLRLRVSQPCPKNYLHPCHVCSIGYTECPAATHRRTYYEADCRRCQQRRMFDPDDNRDGICVTCLRQSRLEE